MATADQVQALIRSHMDGDSERFVAIARQIEAHALSKGHTSIAEQIRRSLLSSSRMIPLSGAVSGLLLMLEPTVKLVDMILEPETRERLDRVLLENRSREMLEEHGLRPRRKLLLVGPPGCGKTMTAQALAAELEMPMFSVQLEGVLKSHLGETGEKIGKIFEHLQSHAGVYLFDEFDALGTERDWSGKDGAAGEMRRVLNTLLQMLEQGESRSLIVAASNHDSMLDRALFRRFDDVIHYPKPARELRESLIQRVLWRTRLQLPDDIQEAADVADGLSQSEIESACLDAAKEAVLGKLSQVPTGALPRCLRGRRRITYDA